MREPPLRRKVRQEDPKASGVVVYYTQQDRNDSAFRELGTAYLVNEVASGLPATELDALQESLGLPAEVVAPMLGISKATFHRHKGAKARLGPEVSDRVVRYARLLGKAIKLFGETDGKRWLNSEQYGLGGAVPLEYAKSEVGAREVEKLLGRIEHGVYS